ncbi:hypothetical protein [Sporosarcina sp.]|nr:hypothetical protein [Sporosarcina sp.]
MNVSLLKMSGQSTARKTDIEAVEPWDMGSTSIVSIMKLHVK